MQQLKMRLRVIINSIIDQKIHTEGMTEEEAMALMMRRAFELGYRRYEWKCDSLNAPSVAAAKREWCTSGHAYPTHWRWARGYRGRSRYGTRSLSTACFCSTAFAWTTKSSSTSHPTRL